MVFKIFFFLFFSIFFFLEQSIRSESCQTSCGYKQIIFPFQLRNQPNEYRCGYPGFDLSCNNQTETIITFPSSGDFSVQMIDYYGQYIGVGDPDGCLARRLLEGFDPFGTPFEQLYLQKFTLLSCSFDVPTLQLNGVTFIPCLSGENSYVVAIHVDHHDLFTILSSCQKIATVLLSLPEKWEYISDRIWLTWKAPDCKKCLRSQGTCKYKKNTGLDVGCSVALDQVKKGSPKMAKYFVLFMVLSFLCLLALVICIPSMVRHYVHRRRGTDTEVAGSIILQSTAARKGLDRRAIEMYPTTLVSESRYLPKPNDTACSICLLEYQVKDTLRTIPSCMHYFHANCIDEWLKRNATCPLCRQ